MSFLAASWPAPANVRTLISTRQDGNLASHVGDDPQVVASNRRKLMAGIEPAPAIQWLRQVHGVDVAEAASAGTVLETDVLEADACMTTTPGAACAVLTADCLPVLLCDKQGSQVAAVHAGWRGLAAGILIAAIKRFMAPPEELLVYLGPAISQAHFEVGSEVLRAFEESPTAKELGAVYRASVRSAFVASATLGRYRADLYGLARRQCTALGIPTVYGGEFCTYHEQQCFYSFRRDGQTGRMANLVWLTP